VIHRQKSEALNKVLENGQPIAVKVATGFRGKEILRSLFGHLIEPKDSFLWR